MNKPFDFVSWHTGLVSGNFDPTPLVTLGEEHLVVFDNCLSTPDALRILQHIRSKQDTFQQAGVGNRILAGKQSDIRNDQIQWIERTEEIEIISPFFQFVDLLTEIMNRYAYLSIKDSEFHYTHYGPGNFYKRHLDQFTLSSNRILSVILYLNPNWEVKNGGQLKVYQTNDSIIIQPLFNRLVLMRSDKIEHEVMINHADRYSITGWLLNQPKSIPIFK